MRSGFRPRRSLVVAALSAALLSPVALTASAGPASASSYCDTAFSGWLWWQRIANNAGDPNADYSYPAWARSHPGKSRYGPEFHAYAVWNSSTWAARYTNAGCPPGDS